MLSQISALAVCDALSFFLDKAFLKWPNDVLVGGKKIAGILAQPDFKRDAVVIGMGLNVNVMTADLEAAGLGKTATSMRIEADRSFDLGEVLFRIIQSMDRWIIEIVSLGGRSLAQAWRPLDWLTGCDIEVGGTSRPIRGTYAGMDERGRLLLEDASGRMHVFWAGDVRKVRIS
jgi:BirA family biotin operon repressor/biotin-[acetyl-CoA-carboxylase] ligase